MVDAYVLFTPGSSAVYTLRLGINTVSGQYSTVYNYTIENTLVASILPNSIQYQHILVNSAVTNYFFVFNTNLAGNLNNTLRGKITRIA